MLFALTQQLLHFFLRFHIANTTSSVSKQNRKFPFTNPNVMSVQPTLLRIFHQKILRQSVS